MLANRYDPEKTGEGWSGYVGNAAAIRSLRHLAAEAKAHREAVVALLHGQTGIGKSLACRLVASVDLGAAPTDVHVAASGRLDRAGIRDMEEEFAYTSLFGSGWKIWIIEEIDQAAAPEIRQLLTFLETVPPRRAVLMTTNAKPTKDLFGSRDTIPEETERAFKGRAYMLKFTTTNLAQVKGKLGPGARRVKDIAERMGIVNGHDDAWFIRHFQSCHNSIRHAVNALATVKD